VELFEGGAEREAEALRVRRIDVDAQEDTDMLADTVELRDIALDTEGLAVEDADAVVVACGLVPTVLVAVAVPVAVREEVAEREEVDVGDGREVAVSERVADDDGEMLDEAESLRDPRDAEAEDEDEGETGVEALLRDERVETAEEDVDLDLLEVEEREGEVDCDKEQRGEMDGRIKFAVGVGVSERVGEEERR
jgi:hypothetical protein